MEGFEYTIVEARGEFGRCALAVRAGVARRKASLKIAPG
jgi:hypothetical protein